MNITIHPLPNGAPSRPLPEKLGFGQIFTDRMFTQKYSEEKGWHDAQIEPYGPFSLDPATVVFHYAQTIFEGTKAYRRPDGHLNLFRPWENAARFNRSAHRMRMQPVDAEFHVEAMAKLVQLEHRWTPTQPGASLYIRPTLIATDPTLGVHASHTYLHYIILSPVGPYFATGFNPLPVLIADKYVRAVRGGTGEAKTGGNYAASLIASEEAKALGYQQVLWLDGVERRYIEEVGAMNIAFAYGKHIVTPALTGTFLPGITRLSILQLAPDLGYTISEEQLDVHQVLKDIKSGAITEAFGMGTAAVIAPVSKFGYQGAEYVIGNGQSGPVATHLFQTLTDIQYGRIPDPYGWTMKIETA